MMQRSMLARTVRESITGALLLSLPFASTFTSSLARAEEKAATTGDAARTSAAALFEEGVHQFERKDYASAARTFLAVDQVLPSARALTNALSAARRAGLPLLVVEAVRRSESRTDLDAEARKLFDVAMAEATRAVARLDVSCTPAPCSLAVDGAVAQPGAVYVEGGAHVVAAEGEGRRAESRLRCDAGATCAAAVTIAAPAPIDEPAPPRAAVEAPSPPMPEQGAKPLPPWVFVAGAVGTAGLTALTIWSGLDTLSARNVYDSDLAAYDPDTVHSRARRTDVLLAGTVVLGGVTAVAGLFFVDWNGGTRAGVSFVPGGGAVFSAGRQF
jgi:hypothetical protein